MGAELVVGLSTIVGGLTSMAVVYVMAFAQGGSKGHTYAKFREAVAKSSSEVVISEVKRPVPRPHPAPLDTISPIEDTFWLDVMGIPLDLWCSMGTCHGPHGYSLTAETIAYLNGRAVLGDFTQPVDLVKHSRRIAPQIRVAGVVASTGISLHCPFCGSGAVVVGQAEFGARQVRCQYCGQGWADQEPGRDSSGWLGSEYSAPVAGTYTDMDLTGVKKAVMQAAKEIEKHFTPEQWAEEHQGHDVDWSRHSDEMCENYLLAQCRNCKRGWIYDFVHLHGEVIDLDHPPSYYFGGVPISTRRSA